MIKMHTSIAGDDWSVAAGESTDRFDAETEARLIESGQAEKVAKTAAKKPAAKPTAKKAS